MRLFVSVLISCLLKTSEQSRKPNVVLILTDDLDSELGTELPLRKTRRWIHENGVQVMGGKIMKSARLLL